jgi:hypothetical protein
LHFSQCFFAEVVKAITDLKQSTTDAVASLRTFIAEQLQEGEMMPLIYLSGIAAFCRPNIISDELFCAEKSFGISKAPLDVYNQIISLGNLEIMEIPFPASYSGVDVSAFLWNDGTEPSQAPRYLQYLSMTIPLENGMTWESVTGTNNLLLLQAAGYKLKGSSDVAVFLESQIQASGPTTIRLRVALLMEIKRTCDDSSFRQGVLELLALSFTGGTPSSWPPLVVVTDLNDTWWFLWLNDGHKIMALSGNRAKSVQLLKDLLTSDDHQVPALPQLNQRGKWRPLAGMNRGGQAVDVANLEDVRDSLTMEESIAHEAQTGFNRVVESNPWLCMYG